MQAVLSFVGLLPRQTEAFKGSPSHLTPAAKGIQDKFSIPNRMRVHSARKLYSHAINEPLSGIFPFRADQKKCHQMISSAAGRSVFLDDFHYWGLATSDHYRFHFS